MEQIKCERCGSDNLLRENGYLVCQNCKAKYRWDDSWYQSFMADDLIDVGVKALRNEDYENAAVFFQRAMEIDPRNGQAFHYYNLASDLYTLWRDGFLYVPILIRRLKSKMGTIIDMYYSIPNADIRKNRLMEAVRDFDRVCCEAANCVSRERRNRRFQNAPERSDQPDIFREHLELICQSYESMIEKLRNQQAEAEIVSEFIARFQRFIRINDLSVFGSGQSYTSPWPGAENDAFFQGQRKNILLRFIDWIKSHIRSWFQ